MENKIEKQKLPANPKKDTPNVSKKKDVALSAGIITFSLGLGTVGAILGAIVWYFVAALFNLQIGYLAILIGVFVGYGMKFVVKDMNSLTMGIIAAMLSLFGLILGNFLIWYFQMPTWTREALVDEFAYTESQAEEITDTEIRENYGFGEYMKDDLTSFDDTDHNPAITWLFYILAVSIGFTRVFDIKNPNKSL